jgi:hypothetical protein
MKSSGQSSNRGSARLAVMVGLTAFACGLAAGPFYAKVFGEAGAPAPPSMQEVINVLSGPMPIPMEAKQIKGMPWGHKLNGAVFWKNGWILDVTGMKPEEYRKIPEQLRVHFLKHFPVGDRTGGLYPALFKKSDKEFIIASNADWTWHDIVRLWGDNFYIDIDAQVYDFEFNAPWFDRLAVKDLEKPVRGQRILWITVDAGGFGLPDSGKQPVRAKSN